MEKLACVLVMFLVSAVCQAETKTYEMSYQSWANDSNYPASRCFSPSFKADEFCGDNAQPIVEDCFSADPSIVAHVESRCNEPGGKVSIAYDRGNGGLLGISGYFGEFNVKYTRSRYLKDLKSLLLVHDHLINERVMAYRVGNPLENRIYIILGDDAYYSHGFKLLEYVKNCKEYVDSRGATSCQVAEYVVSR